MHGLHSTQHPSLHSTSKKWFGNMCPLHGCIRTKPQPLMSQLLSPCFAMQHSGAYSACYICLTIIYPCARLCNHHQSLQGVHSHTRHLVAERSVTLFPCGEGIHAQQNVSAPSLLPHCHAIRLGLPSCLALISAALLLLLDDLLLALCGCLLVSTL